MSQLWEGTFPQPLIEVLSTLRGEFIPACFGKDSTVSRIVAWRLQPASFVMTDLGIRMALGARRGNVLALVLGQGMALAGISILLGVIGALGLTRVLSKMLYEVKPTDPLTFVAVSLVLFLVALLACWLPARRAAGVDPMEALRHE